MQMNAVTCQPSTRCLREIKRVIMLLKLYVCKLCPFPWWAPDRPWRSLICVAWEYKNDRRHLKRNTIYRKIFYSEFVVSRRYYISSCRTPKKLSFNVSLHLPLHSDQDSPFAAQMKMKYAEEYSIQFFKD